MDAQQQTQDIAAISALAAEHGLDIDGSSIRIEDAGLDFRVALVRTTADEAWVLRIPRRPDVLERAAVEARVLELVAPRLEVAVPDWRIHTAELIAYPLLPGRPGLTLDASGSPQWHIDLASTAYAHSLADFLAQLHAIDPDQARAAGIEHRSPDQVRQAWRDDLDRVAAAFEIAPALRKRWDAWIEEDSYWPDFTVLTHGEVYPAHTLVEHERITAVLDWTTAAVDDPAKDLMFHQVGAPAPAFDAMVERYRERGGRVWPRLAEHCAEMFSASPLSYGIFALETGEEEHRRAAAAGLLDGAGS